MRVLCEICAKTSSSLFVLEQWHDESLEKLQTWVQIPDVGPGTREMRRTSFINSSLIRKLEVLSDAQGYLKALGELMHRSGQ